MRTPGVGSWRLEGRQGSCLSLWLGPPSSQETSAWLLGPVAANLTHAERPRDLASRQALGASSGHWGGMAFSSLGSLPVQLESQPGGAGVTGPRLCEPTVGEVGTRLARS